MIYKKRFLAIEDYKVNYGNSMKKQNITQSQ